MKKRIVIPTDFSENAWTALQYAVDLNTQEESEFYILNCYDASKFDIETTENPQMIQGYIQQLANDSKLGLEEILIKIKSSNKLPRHTFHLVSRFDSLENAIKDLVEEYDIDMIIMGTKGVSDSKDVIYGGNATLIMEKIRNCPVLVIPKGLTKVNIQEIVFPTSYKTHYKKRELQHLIDIAKATKSAIRILHVIGKKEVISPEQEKNKELLSDILEGLDFTFHVVHSDNIQEAVNIFVESRGSGMVTFINRKHMFFGSPLNKPMVKELGYHSRIPVLALHDLRN